MRTEMLLLCMKCLADFHTLGTLNSVFQPHMPPLTLWLPMTPLTPHFPAVHLPEPHPGKFYSELSTKKPQHLDSAKRFGGQHGSVLALVKLEQPQWEISTSLNLKVFFLGFQKIWISTLSSQKMMAKYERSF